MNITRMARHCYRAAGLTLILVMAGSSEAEIAGRSRPPGAIAWEGSLIGTMAPAAEKVQARGSDSARKPQELSADKGSKGDLLLKVADVRRLSVAKARLRMAVRLDGVVTALSGTDGDFFFQDDTGGISVDPMQKQSGVKVGDHVEVTGVSNPGLFAASVESSSIRVLGAMDLPVARPVNSSDLNGGLQDSRWIEVHGVVHSAHMIKLFKHDTVALMVQLDGGPVRVLLQDFVGFDYNRLVDATVRVRGVCSTSFNAKRQFIGVGLFVPDRRDLVVIQPASDAPFAGPAKPVRDALQFGQTDHRVKVTGVVTYQSPGRALYIQDGTDGIKVQTSYKDAIALGTEVDVLGFPVMGEYAPILEDGVIRVTGAGHTVAAPLIDVNKVISMNARFLQAPYDQQLVQLEGTMVESHVQGDQQVWIVRQGGEVFEASLPLNARGSLPNFGAGTVLLLTGICRVHTSADREPISFELLLRSGRDVVVVTRASWWTAGHTLYFLAVLAAITLLVALWGAILRRRVKEQTQVIRESEERFRNLAQNDVLTGLPNRLMLEDRTLECLALCKAGNLKAAVFTADIDRFKHINDTYGHQIADECLKTVAKRLRSKVRQTDTIARTGGEEFTIVIGGLPNIEAARRVATTMLDLFLEPVVLPDREIKITVSIGGAIYPDDGLDTETLHKRSDQALYEAKRTGRNRAVFATPELAASSELATSIEGFLREGLRSDKFALHYQPVCDGGGTIRRFEALLRTTDQQLGEVGLARFIPVAEESSLILPLGRWIFEEACRQIAAWQAAGHRPCPVAVNVSGKQLGQKGYADEVLQAMERYSIDPGLLQLELTETSVMTEVGSVRDTINRLAEAGLSFAIDDFGTGYSSLSRLHELPIKTLKIDRSFVQNLEAGGGGTHSIVLAIIQMAKGLDVQVVAEGVETPDQFSILKEMGCDLFQGYLFAKPAPADSAIQSFLDSSAEIAMEGLIYLPAMPASQQVGTTAPL